MRSQLNRGRRLISAFVPALAWWRASRARMFHSWRHRSGLSNEAAILQFRNLEVRIPSRRSQPLCQRPGRAVFGDPVTHHTTDVQPITKSARRSLGARVGGQLGGRPVSVRRLRSSRPRLYSIAHDARFFVDAALISHQEMAGRGAPSLLLVFNNSVKTLHGPSCCRPVGAHVMSGKLVKLALAGAAESVLIWVHSNFLGTALCAGTCWASNSARGVLEIDIPRHHVSLCQLLANACMAASRVGS